MQLRIAELHNWVEGEKGYCAWIEDEGIKMENPRKE